MYICESYVVQSDERRPSERGLGLKEELNKSHVNRGANRGLTARILCISNYACVELLIFVRHPRKRLCNMTPSRGRQ